MGAGVKVLDADGQIESYTDLGANPAIDGLRSSLRGDTGSGRASDNPTSPAPSNGSTGADPDPAAEANQVSRPIINTGDKLGAVDKFGEQTPDEETDPEEDLTPQQKAARTRAANKAKAEAEAADADPDEDPELDEDGNPVDPDAEPGDEADPES